MPNPSPFKFSGNAASLIFYERFNSFSQKLKKGKAGHSRLDNPADIFSGKANRMAKQACVALAQVSDLAVSREVNKRLCHAFHHWFLTALPGQATPRSFVPLVSGFRFNEDSFINQKFEINLDVSWKTNDSAVLRIPVIHPRKDIIAPARTVSIQLKLVAASISTNPARGTQFLKKISLGPKQKPGMCIDIPYVKGGLPGREIQIPLVNQPGNIVILIAALQYTTMQQGKMNIVTDRKWLPADILSAIYIH